MPARRSCKWIVGFKEALRLREEGAQGNELSETAELKVNVVNIILNRVCVRGMLRR